MTVDDLLSRSDGVFLACISAVRTPENTDCLAVVVSPQTAVERLGAPESLRHRSSPVVMAMPHAVARQMFSEVLPAEVAAVLCAEMVDGMVAIAEASRGWVRLEVPNAALPVVPAYVRERSRIDLETGATLSDGITARGGDA